MVDRNSTGIKFLDDLIEGGYKRGSINLVEGTAGSGKSTLAVHFAAIGMELDEPTLYLSIEEEKDSFFENMARFGFDLEAFEASGKFKFIELNSEKLRDFISKGTLGVEQDIVSMQVKRIVIDSITAFTLLYETEAKQRIAVQTLFEKLKTWNPTTLLLAEDSKDYGSYLLRYLVDGVLRLRYNKVGNERVRSIEVLKMRGTNHRSTEIVYRIESNGIILYPNETMLNQ